MDQAVAEADKAVVLGPGYADAHATRGGILIYASRPAEAIESLEKAMQLEPRYPTLWLHFLAHAHFIDHGYNEAVRLLKRRIRQQPDTDISRALLAACYGHLGFTAKARDAWAGLREINPDFSIERRAKVVPYRNPDDWELFVDGLRKAGLPA
ncbi:MAG: tetratricopeptide repeat protein [Alphaproteobacteria bacterium]|nr:tetratricopeptide repeat protein [Alphaproteobacteria bacterium]